jgi:hypothetical protein
MQTTTEKRRWHGAMIVALSAALLFSCYCKGMAGESDGNQYVGVEKCKNCHSAAAKGSPYDKWMASEHHKAFEVLASDEAKKVAKEKNIAEPQKDAACAACHVTAFEAPATQKGKKFDPTQGVQCEACHGPGGNHVKARLAAEEVTEDKVAQIGKGEIISIPPAETCKKCHNDKSPSYKAFDYVAFLKKIQHMDPRRNHPADFLDKLGTDAGEAKK